MAARSRKVGRTVYNPPGSFTEFRLADLLPPGRAIPEAQQKRFGFAADRSEPPKSPILFCAGDVALIARPCVAIVGSRKVSPEGIRRARRLAKELVEARVVVVSGLAQGVDEAAHTAAIEANGRTIAVIGTPLNVAYPAAHKELQERIYRDHLLISQFEIGSRVFPSNFPQRNQIMAAISDATVIVEASDTSGTIHQAAECARLGRWLFIANSVVENPELTWPRQFLELPKARVLRSTHEVLAAIGGQP